MIRDQHNEYRLIQAVEGLYQPEERNKDATLTMKIDDWLWVEHALRIRFRESLFDLADAAQVKKIISAVQETIFRVVKIEE